MSIYSNTPLVANQLPVSLDIPEDQEKFHEFLELHLKKVSDIVNTKIGGLYSLNELYAFKQYFTVGDNNIFRNVYRKSFDMGATIASPIAPGGTASFAHGISGLKYAVNIVAQCTEATPILFMSGFSVMGLADVWLDATNVNFKNNSAVPLTTVYVVAEYLKT